jgi:lipid-A-disaccharide synthase
LTAWHPLEKLAVRGYVEVLATIAKSRHPPQTSSAACWLTRRTCSSASMRRISTYRSKRRSSGTVLPDRPLRQPVDLGLARRTHPQIGAAVSRVLALFPFEPALYEKQGIPGELCRPSAGRHAAARRWPRGGADAARLSPATPVFALLPGSRQSELQYMAETFIETARRMHEQIPEAIFLAPLATRETRVLFESALHRRAGEAVAYSPALRTRPSGDDGRRPRSGRQRHGDPRGRTAQATDGHRLQDGAAVLPNDAPHGLPALCRSAERPGRRFVVPEFIQDEATAENLAQALLNLYADKEACERIKAVFRRCICNCGRTPPRRRLQQSSPACQQQRCASMLLLLPVEGLVCGVDEAGRGPLAGPVVAAAVILDPGRPIAA